MVVEPANDWEFIGETDVKDAEVAELAEVEQEQIDDLEVELDAKQADDEPEELSLIIDGEEVAPASDDVELPDDAPNWARDLRQKYKDATRLAKELELKVKAAEPKREAVKIIERPKPKLEDCDFDTERFEADLDNWYSERKQIEAEKSRVESEQNKFKSELQEKANYYELKRADILKRESDYVDAESAVLESLSVEAQNQLLLYAEDPTALVLALGRNKSLLNTVAQMQNDPLRLAVKIGELNKSAKFAPRVKKTFNQEPKVRAQNVKPQNESDKRFSSAFPDAEFK